MNYNETALTIALNSNRSFAANSRYHFYPYALITENLFPLVYSWDNLFEAYLDCFKNTTKSLEMLDSSHHFSDFMCIIEESLIKKTFVPEEPHKFIVHDPKERTIKAPRFMTRVVQKALIQAVGPFLDSFAVPFSCANIPGRGSIMVSDKVMEIINTCPFVLLMDVHHYFPSINNTNLRCMIYDLVKDPGLNWLLNLCIPSSPVSIDIGSITSQYFANLYLDPLDKVIFYGLGNTNYCRYMDDFIVGASSYEEAYYLFNFISQFLYNILGLTLNQHSGVIPSYSTFEFVGFRFENRQKKMKEIRLQNVLDEIAKFKMYRYGIEMYPFLLKDIVVNYIQNARLHTEEEKGLNIVMNALYEIGIAHPLAKKPLLHVLSA